MLQEKLEQKRQAEQQMMLHKQQQGPGGAPAATGAQEAANPLSDIQKVRAEALAARQPGMMTPPATAGQTPPLAQAPAAGQPRMPGTPTDVPAHPR